MLLTCYRTKHIHLKTMGSDESLSAGLEQLSLGKIDQNVQAALGPDGDIAKAEDSSSEDEARHGTRDQPDGPNAVLETKSSTPKAKKKKKKKRSKSTKVFLQSVSVCPTPLTLLQVVDASNGGCVPPEQRVVNPKESPEQVRYWAQELRKGRPTVQILPFGMLDEKVRLTIL